MTAPLFSIAPTSNGAGIGVTATSLIKPGTLIVSNPPLVQVHRTSETAHEDLTALVDALERPEVYRDLCRSLPEQEGNELGDWDVLSTNGFGLAGASGEDERTTGVYEQISRFNHTCTPNAAHHFNPLTSQGELWSLHTIPPHSEISISYILNDQPLHLRQMELQLRYHFTCTCESCTLPPPLQRQSDINRYSAQRLDQLIQNDPDTFALPLYAASLRIDFLRKERLGNGSEVGQTLYDAFQMCLAYGKVERAKVYAKLAARERRAFEGKESVNGKAMEALAADPAAYAASGSRNEEGVLPETEEDKKAMKVLLERVEKGEGAEVLEELKQQAAEWMSKEEKADMDELLEDCTESMLVAGN